MSDRAVSASSAQRWALVATARLSPSGALPAGPRKPVCALLGPSTLGTAAPAVDFSDTTPTSGTGRIVGSSEGAATPPAPTASQAAARSPEQPRAVDVSREFRCTRGLALTKFRVFEKYPFLHGSGDVPRSKEFVVSGKSECWKPLSSPVSIATISLSGLFTSAGWTMSPTWRVVNEKIPVGWVSAKAEPARKDRNPRTARAITAGGCRSAFS